METTTLLEADLGIRATIGAMMRAVDERDWAGVLEYIDPDFEWGAVNAAIRATGADKFVEWQKANLAPGVRAQHVLGSNALAKIDGDIATVSCASTICLYSEAQVSVPVSKSGGDVTYTLRREGERWKVMSVAIRVMWAEGAPMVPDADPASR